MPTAPRRTLPALALTLGLLAAPLGPSAADAAPAGPAAQSPATKSTVAKSTVPTKPLRIVTYNIRASVSTDTFRSAVRAVLPSADIAGFQEVNSNHKEAVLGGLYDTHGFDYFRYVESGLGSGQTPVVWRADRFDLVDARGELLAEGRNIGVEEDPLNDGYRAPKWATVVRLYDTWTGRNVSVVNAHLPQGATWGGDPVAGKPDLQRMYRESLRSLTAVVQTERGWGTTYVLGDFNIGWVADAKKKRAKYPYATMKRIGMGANWERGYPKRYGTFDKVNLDHIYSTSKPVKTQIMKKVAYSDHRPGWAQYEVPVTAASRG